MWFASAIWLACVPFSVRMVEAFNNSFDRIGLHLEEDSSCIEEGEIYACHVTCHSLDPGAAPGA